MGLILSSISTSIANLIIFSLIPFLWWFFRHRKETGFFRWTGFIRPHLRSKWWVLIVFAVVYYFFYNFDFTRLVDPDTLAYIENSSAVSANAFAGIGAAAIIPALIENFIANGVAEEILLPGIPVQTSLRKAGNCRRHPAAGSPLRADAQYFIHDRRTGRGTVVSHPDFRIHRHGRPAFRLAQRKNLQRFYHPGDSAPRRGELHRHHAGGILRPRPTAMTKCQRNI